MDVSSLRQQYRMCRDKQRTEFHLLRTGSSDLLDVVSIVPVAQGWTSSWQPARPSPPDPKTSDPWRVHLDLHRRRPAVAMETERSRSRSSSQAPPTDRHTAGSGSAPSRGGFTRRCASLDQNQKQDQNQDQDQDQNQNQNQNPRGGSGAFLNCYPFPSRRTLRISEAARRLGLYPSS